jgi:hypothetical protein
MVNSEELIGTKEYLTLYKMCRINRCCYNRVRMYIISFSYLYLWIFELRLKSDHVGSEDAVRCILGSCPKFENVRSRNQNLTLYLPCIFK